MCNTFTQRPKKGAIDWQARVNASVAALKKAMVRKSDPGVVIRMEAGEFEPVTMRWGFARSFSSSINNARTDKLDSPTWAAAFLDRRCIIPASSFFEWQQTPSGPGQCYEFHCVDEDWMWIAGMWEPSDKFGPCFTMVTTDAPPLMAPIHSRMPAVLSLADALGFLRGDLGVPSPYEGGGLQFVPVPSPLKKQEKEPPLDPQGTLF